MSSEQYDGHQQIATEILELGQALFDMLIEAASRPVAGPEGQPFPTKEVSEATQQFFTSLRLLLKLDAL